MKLEKIYIVLGPPGSGKGTQSELLAKFLKVPRIVIGDLRREFVKGTSVEAKEDKARIDQGIPAPDHIVSKLLKDKIAQLPQTDTIVLDTFPLSMGQVEILDDIAQASGTKYFRVVFLNVNEKEAVHRVMERKQASRQVRSDDDSDIARQRYERYAELNTPIKAHYRELGVLVEINGEQPIEGTHQEVLRKLGLV